MVILLVFTIFFTILLAFMIYTSDAHWTIKALALAVFLVFDVIAFENYREMLGAPIQARPDGEFAYVWHTITEEPEIVVWLFDRERGYRLYQYEYTRDDAEELEKMRQRAAEGNGDQQFLRYSDPAGEGLQEYEGWIHKNQNRLKPPDQDGLNFGGP